MRAPNPIEREGLGDPVGAVQLNDCELTFRRQVATNDVWCVATGPLGTFAYCVITDEVLRLVQRPARDASRDELSRRRTMTWPQVRIGDDFVVAVRAAGNRLSYAYLFGDGAAFGGGESGLPSARQSTPLDRARSWLSGARGSSIQIFRHKG